MDNEKIKELAQSYVDELFAHDDMTEQENIEAKNDALVMCMAFAGHILETHCIVEKSKVLKEYDYYKNSWNETELTETIMESLEDIFGKELFNTTEK